MANLNIPLWFMQYPESQFELLPDSIKLIAHHKYNLEPNLNLSASPNLNRNIDDSGPDDDTKLGLFICADISGNIMLS